MCGGPMSYGSTLFLVASVFGIFAVGRFWSFQPRSVPWQIAWLNMIGSILFMASALGSYVLPATGDLVNVPDHRPRHSARRVVFLDRGRTDVPGVEAVRAEPRCRAPHQPMTQEPVINIHPCEPAAPSQPPQLLYPSR